MINTDQLQLSTLFHDSLEVAPIFLLAYVNLWHVFPFLSGFF